MSLSLTNRDDVIAHSFSITTANGSIVNILDAVHGSVVGLPPATLNTLEQLSAAISNDPNYFNTINGAIGSKASAATTYSKTETNNLLEGKTDDGELTTAVSNLTTAINGKQNKFLLAETVPATAGRIFDVGSSKFRAVNVSAPLSITPPGFDYLAITSDTYDKANIDGKITTINIDIGTKRNTVDSYTKTEVDNNIAAVVGAAPALLNTLVELSAAFGNDTNYATNVASALTAKAPLESPTLTGIATAANLTVSVGGKLFVGTTNVMTELDLKATKESPTFTGTATANNLVVSGTVSITGNITAPNVYTKGETDTKLLTKQATITMVGVANTMGLFDGARMYPIKEGMGMQIYQTIGDNFVTIDGPYNCENLYYPTAYPNLIQMLNIARKELKALKAGVNIAISDDGQLVSISAPNVYTKTESDAVSTNILDSLNGKLATTSTLLTNTAVAGSSGATSSTHTLHTGPLSLVIATPNNINAMEISGTDAGLLNEGVTTCYKAVNIEGLLSLGVGANKTDIITLSGLKANQDTTYSKLQTNSLLDTKGDKTNPNYIGNMIISNALNEASSVSYKVQNQGTGYSSYYLNAPNEQAQIWCGNGYGLNLRTNTDHPISFSINGSPNSMQILSTGVEITGDLNVSGTISNINPNWISVVINYIAGVPFFQRANGGRYTASSLARQSGQSTGVLQFDFPAHPQGANYIITATASGALATISTAVRSSTRIGIIMRNSVNLAYVDAEVHVCISAY